MEGSRHGYLESVRTARVMYQQNGGGRNNSRWNGKRFIRPCYRNTRAPSCSSYLLLSLWPKSNPKWGADFVPVTLTGSSVPAPCLLKNGSTGFSRTDFQPVIVRESLASMRTFP